MNSFLNFADVKVRIGEHGFGRCHVCCGNGLTTYEDPILGRLRVDHPEWFKTPQERTALDTGHWMRHHFKDDFQAEATARYNEIRAVESEKPVVLMLVDEKAIHICEKCLVAMHKPLFLNSMLEAASSPSTDMIPPTTAPDEPESSDRFNMPIVVPKNKGGRPKKKA